MLFVISMTFLIGMILGGILLLAYILYRMMKNPGWDDSNITNALRLLSHVCLHPEDFGKMWYAKPSEDKSRWEVTKRPFWYVSKDELSEVVDTRP